MTQITRANHRYTWVVIAGFALVATSFALVAPSSRYRAELDSVVRDQLTEKQLSERLNMKFELLAMPNALQLSHRGQNVNFRQSSFALRASEDR